MAREESKELSDNPSRGSEAKGRGLRGSEDELRLDAEYSTSEGTLLLLMVGMNIQLFFSVGSENLVSFFLFSSGRFHVGKIEILMFKTI